MKTLEVKSKGWPRAYFREVELATFKLAKDDYGNPKFDAAFKAKTASQSWMQSTLQGVVRLPGQSSLDNTLNPSDHYFSLEENSEKSDEFVAGTGSGPTPDIEFILHFVPASIKDIATHHLSFYAGMMGGQHWWLLYRLCFDQTQLVGFEFVKRYCYTQGQAVSLEAWYAKTSS